MLSFRNVIHNGLALKAFQKMIEFQGVKSTDASTLCNGDMWQVLKKSEHSTTLTSHINGTIEEIDALKIGTSQIRPKSVFLLSIVKQLCF